MQTLTIGELVRVMDSDDKEGFTQSSEYVSNSMREDINKTEAYINSKHISGDKDYLKRDKPFFNICIGARNIWYRATDIDSKNVRILPENSKEEIGAFLMTILLQDWMKEVKFGKFLNDWGLTLATHGSAVSKFVEKGGELSCQSVDWNNLICDPIDFEGNPKIEKLYFTPAQLKQQKGYDQELVNLLLDNLVPRETVKGEQKDNKANYICVYEIHGNLPLSYLTGKDKDKDEFVQQMHILTFQDSKKKGEYDDYALYSGRERIDPYFITHLIKKDGQTYTGGAVKNLFEAQWMVNHSQKQIKDYLDLASKQLFQTSDNTFFGKNALTNVENGAILIHKVNEGLTQLNNTPNIVGMQSNKADWQNIANQINGISEAMAGQNSPSGTAWRQTQALLQESHSLFELMTENKGLSLEEMFRDIVIPFFIKQLNHSDEIAAILEEHQVREFDARYIPNETIRRVNKKKKETILSGEIYDPAMEGQDMMEAEQGIKSELTGNVRFIKPSDVKNKTWKEILDGIGKKLIIDITGENKDFQSAMATLDNTFKTLVALQGRPLSENEQLILNKILSYSGTISPLEMSFNKAQPAPQPAMAGAGVGGGQAPQLTPNQ